MLKVATMLHKKFTIRTEGVRKLPLKLLYLCGTWNHWKGSKSQKPHHHINTPENTFSFCKGKCTKHIVLTLATKVSWIPTEPNQASVTIQSISLTGHVWTQQCRMRHKHRKTFTIKLFRYADITVPTEVSSIYV